MKTSRARHVPVAVLLATAVASPLFADVTIDTSNSSAWKINNGALAVTYVPNSTKITSIKVVNANGSLGSELIDLTSTSGGTPKGLYAELASYDLGGSTTTANYQVVAGKYVDFYTTISDEIGTATDGKTAANFTITNHFVLFNGDPTLHMYAVLTHSASNANAAGFGQGQFLFRSDLNEFTKQYQYNVSVTSPGATTTTLDNNGMNAAGAVTGRNVQDATVDLTGTSAAATYGMNFYTKYNESSYEQLHQGQTEYGSNYAISTVLPSTETMTGGPTKQDLQFTGNLLMAEYTSGHYGTGNGYTMAANTASSRLFGVYDFRIVPTNGETGAQLYNDAINSGASERALDETDSLLLAAGYVPANQRGMLTANVSSTAGWNGNTNYNTIVLSDQHVGFQNSHQGYQYWTQLDTAGHGTITGIAPGTYRATVYQLGQWGETRYDNVQINANQNNTPANLKFVPENFSTAAPIWTIGTPDRSAHEFLNGHTATGADLRQFQGNYNYWKEMADLGTPGKVVYYATAVGATAATNDPNKWIANEWKTFNPGIYDAGNNSTDYYSAGPVTDPVTAPQYVRDGGGPATYPGSPWEVHFTTTTAQQAQGRYIIISVGIAAAEASLTLTLNGQQRTWRSGGSSDPMTRSGDAGYYQWAAFEFDNGTDLAHPSVLSAAGVDNLLQLSVSQTNGIMFDALRMEISNVSANPGVTGWTDYSYVTSTALTNTANPNEAASLAVTNNQAPIPEPASLALLAAAPMLLLRRRSRSK